MVHSNEDATISASDTSEMRVKWFNQTQADYGCLFLVFTFLWILSLQSVQSHDINKVTSSRFSVVSIDGCHLGTVYFVHRNARLPLHWLSVIKTMSIKLIESQAFPDDRTVSILTVHITTVNNLISFWGMKVNISTSLRFENIKIYTQSFCQYSNHTRPQFWIERVLKIILDSEAYIDIGDTGIPP